MIAKNAALVASLLLVVGCKAQARTDNRPAPAAGTVSPAAGTAIPAAAPTPPAKVTARVRGGDGEEKLTATFEVESAGAVHEVVLASEFGSCETSEAPVEKVAALGDDRLRVVQLFCENGEDFFHREMITALLLATDAPRLLWQGHGSYSNSNGECATSDVVWFRRGRENVVEVVRTSEVESSGEEPDCAAQAPTETVEATIDLP